MGRLRRLAVCLLIILAAAFVIPEAASRTPEGMILTAEAREKTGWHGSGAGRYYVDKNGKKPTGLKKVGNYWYYFGSGGKPRTGFQVISGRTYFFRTSSDQKHGRERGAMLTGWLFYNNNHYYFCTKATSRYKLGQALEGWNTIGKGRYFFRKKKETKSGRTYPRFSMATGWRDEGSDSFFCDPRKDSRTYGQALTGWQSISGEKYYFFKSTISSIRGHKKYAAAKGAVTVDGKRYYFKVTNGVPRAGSMIQTQVVKGIIKKPSFEVVTPQCWIRNNTERKETMTVNTRNGRRTITIYKQTFFTEPTLRNHGCAISATTVALNLMGASAYRNISPLQAHRELEKKAFGFMRENAPISALGAKTLLASCGIKSTYLQSFTEKSAAIAIESNLRQGRPVICWMGKGPDEKWDPYMHTICLVGITDTGRIIVADSSNRTWAGMKQRLKLVEMKDITPYLIPVTQKAAGPYWQGINNSCGILLIK